MPRQPLEHPPLGIDVPSYPTPLVADVVFAESKDPRTPNYAAAAYGTAHPDTTAWPNHKLVHISPVQADQRVMWVYAADRSNQDAYDFTLKYTAESIAHKIIVRESLELRSTYTPLAALTPDTVTASCLCTHEETSRAEPEYDSLYIKVLRVFEALPGPVLTSVDDSAGEAGNVTITKQRVVAGTAPAAFVYGVNKAAVEATDANTSEKITITQSHPQITGQTQSAQADAATATITKQRVPAGTAVTVGFGVISSVNEPVDEAHTDKTVVSVSGFPILTSKEMDREAMGETSTTTKQTLDASTVTMPTIDYLTLDAKLAARDKFHTDKIVKTVSSYPIIVGVEVDSSGLLIDLKKQYIEIPAYGSGGSYDAASGETVEVQPYDKYKSIQITSRIRNGQTHQLTPLYTYPIKVRIALPDIVTNAIFEAVKSGGDVPSATAGIYMTIKNGYNGPAEAVVTEFYTIGPKTSVPPVTKFFPQAEQILWQYYDSPRIAQEILHIPTSLHSAMDLLVSSDPNAFGFGVVHPSTIAATQPSSWSSGQQLIHAVEQSPTGKMGLWKTTIVTVTIP